MIIYVKSSKLDTYQTSNLTIFTILELVFLEVLKVYISLAFKLSYSHKFNSTTWFYHET